MKWITLGRLAAELSAFASTVVLAHLLTPAELGRAAIGMIGVAVALAVLTQGIGSAIVQRPEIDRRHLEAAGLLCTGLGLVLAVLVGVGAPLVLPPVVGSETAFLLALTAPVFLLGGLVAVPYAMLQRKLDFKTLSLAEMTGTAVSAVTAIALGVAGLGGESVILGAVAFQATVTGILVVASRPPRPRWRRGEVRALGKFGVSTALGSLAYVGYRSVDYAIIGARLGAASLGYYWRAYQLALDYQGKVSGIMLRIAFPLYSRAGTLEEMRRVRARVVRAHAVILLPPLALLIVLAPELVPWVFGAQWRPAVEATQILCVAGMIAAVVTGMGPLLLAAGRPNALLWWNLAIGFVLGGVVYFTAPYGITAVCIGVVGTHMVSFVASHYLLLYRIVGIPMRQVIEDVAPGLAAAVAALAVGGAATWLVGRAGAPVVLHLAAVSLLATVAWIGTLRIVSPAAWADVSALAARVLPRPVLGLLSMQRRVRRAPTTEPVSLPSEG